MTKKQLEQKIKTIKAQRVAERETLKAERTIKYYESARYLDDSMKEEALAVLTGAITDISIVYKELDRKIIQKFGYSVILDKLLTLAGSLKYLPQVEKQDLLEVVGISEVSIEELLDAVGSTAYYSKDSHTIVPEIALDRENLREVLEKIEVELNIELTSEMKYLTESKITSMYKRSLLTAEEMYLNTETMAIEDKINYEE